MTDKVPLGELLPVLATEARRRMLVLGATFALIAITALVIGIGLPRRYESSTTLVLEPSRIATALPGDRAVPAGSVDHVARARELLANRKVIDEVLAADGAAAQRSAAEQDQMVEALGERIEITSPRDDQVRIRYRDDDPLRALRITRQLGELFVRERLAAQERESRSVFDFLDRQVKAYQRKLTDAEDKLKSYREAADAVTPANDGKARVSQLLDQVERARRELVEQRAREDALATQLAEPSAAPATDTAPATSSYEELRDKLAVARRERVATASRLDQAEAALKTDLGKTDGAHANNELAGVIRDYEANRSVVEDLLKRRENARIAMDLDSHQQGLSVRIQQPATMPQHASGLRLLHLAVGGLLLAILVPLGMLLARARLDPRVRSAAQVERLTGLPMLATIPTCPTPAERRRTTMHASALALIVFGVLLCYTAAFLLQLRASP
ncbi:hypothetical protein [Dokdonella sp.]|uniref:hypothetical protein n=1 Tax=Dokdonella sp. TaxID=2291710 RepID=UPI003783BAC7